MIRSCLSPDALADLVAGEGTAEDCQHLGECQACTRRVQLARRVATAGVDEVSDALTEVEELVERLLRFPRASWWKLVREDEYERPDVARRVLCLAVDARLSDRHLALDLANAATTILDRLGNVRWIGDLRFEAWKVTASLRREAGSYATSEDALARAEQFIPVTSEPELALATILLSRALLNAEPDVWQPEQASALLDRAEAIIARNDRTRMPAVLSARALLMFRSGDLPGARDAFAALLRVVPRTDREGYLHAMNNLMGVRVELRDSSDEVYQAVRLLFEENLAAGRTVAAAHARWMLGRIHALRGDYGRAVRSLMKAMREIGEGDTSIRVGLDAAEALLLSNRHSEALGLARELAALAVALDQREPSRRRALTAEVLAYLREAAQRQAWTPDLVADLGRYVDRITRQRPFDFVPPMPLALM